MGLNDIVLSGLAVAPGISLGRAVLVDGHYGLLSAEERIIPEAEVELEVKRFLVAIETSRKQLDRIQQHMAEAVDRQHAQIFMAQAAFLDDDLIVADTVAAIRRECRSADYLLHRRVTELVSQLASCEDEFFRARNNDVLDVTNRVMSNLSHGRQTLGPTPYGPDTVIVAPDLAPSETAQLFKNPIRGLVLEKGGITSHTAILAKALGIPAVVGVAGLLQHVRTGELIIVDGSRGSVRLRPNPAAVALAEQDIQLWAEEQRSLEMLRDQPALTPDGTSVILMANVELPMEIEQMPHFGAEGIGLFRTEFLFMNRREPPSEEEQYNIYRDVMEKIPDKPVTFRTLDFGGDKLPFAGMAHEANPFMGVRAIRLCLARRSIFHAQLRAILRAAVHGQVKILIPMVSGVEEILEVRRELDICAAQLRQEGKPHRRDLPLGAMIEIPSAAVMADLLAPHCDFFSIGSNDLVQYTLAVDRGNEGVAYLFEPWHPAVVRLILRTIEAAEEHQIPCSICGEIASDPAYVALLVGMGFRELSMTATCIPRVKNLIRAIPLGEARMLAADVVTQRDLAGIRRVVTTRLSPYLPLGFPSEKPTKSQDHDSAWNLSSVTVPGSS
jgi:phosphotransferase system enzyme I (PtsI)